MRRVLPVPVLHLAISQALQGSTGGRQFSSPSSKPQNSHFVACDCPLLPHTLGHTFMSVSLVCRGMNLQRNVCRAETFLKPGGCSSQHSMTHIRCLPLHGCLILQEMYFPEPQIHYGAHVSSYCVFICSTSYISQSSLSLTCGRPGFLKGLTWVSP